MKNSIFVIVSMFFLGCSEPTPNHQTCMSDSDCRNGEHCNLFFSACEANTYDAAISSDAGVADSPSLSETDSSMLEADAGMAIPEDAYASPDASLTSSNLALRFDGEGDKVTLPVIAGFGQNFTFEAWVRPTNATYLSDVGGFIFQRRSSSRDVTLFFSRNSDSRFGFQVNSTLVRAGNESTLNEWHHVAGVLYNGDVSIFVDGVLEGRIPGSERVQWDLSSQEFVIGREGFETDIRRGVFIGEIDEIRLSSSPRYIEDVYGVPSNLEADVLTTAMFELNDDGPTVHSSDGSISGSLVGATWAACRR